MAIPKRDEIKLRVLNLLTKHFGKVNKAQVVDFSLKISYIMLTSSKIKFFIIFSFFLSSSKIFPQDSPWQVINMTQTTVGNEKYSIGDFKKTILINNYLFSVAECPRVPGYTYNSAPYYGIYIFKTSLKSGETEISPSSIKSSEIPSARPLAYDAKDIAINTEFSSDSFVGRPIYYTRKTRDGFTSGDIIYNRSKKDVEIKGISFKNKMEIKESGDIETYDLIDYKVADRAVVQIFKSQFNNQRYLFIYDYFPNKYLPKIKLENYGLENSKIYKINNGPNGLIILFQTREGLIPLIIKDSEIQKKSLIKFNWENQNVESYASWDFPLQEIYFTDDGGLIKHSYSLTRKNTNFNSITRLQIYNKNFDTPQEVLINGFKAVTQIFTSRNFILIGGYTKESGYKGYLNPKFQILRKIDLKIVHDEVFPLKDAFIDEIIFGGNSFQYDDNTKKYKPKLQDLVLAIVDVSLKTSPLQTRFLYTHMDKEGNLVKPEPFVPEPNIVKEPKRKIYPKSTLQKERIEKKDILTKEKASELLKKSKINNS